MQNSTPPAYGDLEENLPSEKDGINHSTNSNEDLPKNEKTCCQKALRLLRANILVVLLIIALLIGIGIGAGLRGVEPKLTKREIMYLRFPGEILMNMLQLVILPLIVSSLVSGMTSLDSRASGKLGARACLYYLTSTLMAVILGIILVLSIKPGERGDRPVVVDSTFRKVEPADTFLDLIRQMFPDNIIEACFSKKLTILKKVVKKGNMSEEQVNKTMYSNTTIEDEYEPVIEKAGGINMLGLVTFSIAFGIAINKLGEKGKPLKYFVESLCDATLLLVSAVIWYSPIGVLFLIASQVVSMDDPIQSFEQLGFYFLTVMVGLAIHGYIVLPLLYFVLVRKNPYTFIFGMTQALMTAIGTSSSSATLPVTMKNLEENNGIDPRITAFVAPVGATINMDGTALYEAVAVIFIGQIRGYSMGIGSVITICITSTAAAIGAAGVPQAGLVTMVIVLTSVGFPVDDVAMILAVDWLLDRFRTMINVLGDAIGAGIVFHYSKADLRKMDEADKKEQEILTNKDNEDESKTIIAENKDSKNNGGMDNHGFNSPL
uniref:Amino acid transporter n=1 Tax=Arion vulgaris TaxID=1028688 RepID=A0A0B7ACB0_9EUPU